MVSNNLRDNFPIIFHFFFYLFLEKGSEISKLAEQNDAWIEHKFFSQDEAIELLKQTTLKNNEENSKFIFKFKIIINELFDELSPTNQRKLFQIFKKRALIVYVVSKENKKFLIYWKTKHTRQILFLKPYQETFTEKDRHICDFASNFLASSLRNDHLGKFKLIIRILSDYFSFKLY